MNIIATLLITAVMGVMVFWGLTVGIYCDVTGNNSEICGPVLSNTEGEKP